MIKINLWQLNLNLNLNLFFRYRIQVYGKIGILIKEYILRIRKLHIIIIVLLSYDKNDLLRTIKTKKMQVLKHTNFN